MSGLYIHVPFCASRCIYCDFFSTVSSADAREAYVEALCLELTARRQTAGRGQLSTIYIGGGTPSLLSAAEIRRIWQTVSSCFEVLPQAEVTIEANPDDVSDSFVDAIRQTGINRISLGIQSFDDTTLRFLRRRHSARQACQAIDRLHDAGFTNLSIDLIYGLPGQDLESFTHDLQKAFSLPIKHLSTYVLSFEEGTRLSQLKAMGTVREADEELSRAMFYAVIAEAEARGWNHYEISNFALPGYHSRHNSSYWDGTPYIGCGPGAHSFDGHSVRRWNLPNLHDYIAQAGRAPFDEEHLSPAEQRNDYVLTSLRTKLGLSLQAFTERFGADACCELLAAAGPHVRSGRLLHHDGRLSLTHESLFVSDAIISDLMIV